MSTIWAYLGTLAFSRLLRLISTYQRTLGFRLVVYLDDALMVEASKKLTEETVKETTSLLESLGFVINQEKSVFKPAQSMDYIGLFINTTTMRIGLNEKKIRHFKDLFIRFGETVNCATRYGVNFYQLELCLARSRVCSSSLQE